MPHLQPMDLEYLKLISQKNAFHADRQSPRQKFCDICLKMVRAKRTHISAVRKGAGSWPRITVPAIVDSIWGRPGARRRCPARGLDGSAVRRKFGKDKRRPFCRMDQIHRARPSEIPDAARNFRTTHVRLFGERVSLKPSGNWSGRRDSTPRPQPWQDSIR